MRGREPRRTVAEQVEELRVLLDTLLHAENANLPQLIVEHPLAERTLHDVGAVEAVSRILSAGEVRGGEREGDAPVHAVGAHDRGLLALRLARRLGCVMEEVAVATRDSSISCGSL